jgi:hypothetical protein
LKEIAACISAAAGAAMMMESCRAEVDLAAALEQRDELIDRRV